MLVKLFSEHDSLKFEKIADLSGVSSEICEKWLQFWVHKGVLIKQEDGYRCGYEDVVEAGPLAQMDTEDNEQEVKLKKRERG